MENKVIVEITKDGWQTTVHYNGETFIEKHQSTATGSISLEGDLENDDIPDALYESLNGFYAFEVMKSLQRI